jgi:hypothetical protein
LVEAVLAARRHAIPVSEDWLELNLGKVEKPS